MINGYFNIISAAKYDVNMILYNIASCMLRKTTYMVQTIYDLDFIQSAKPQFT